MPSGPGPDTRDPIDSFLSEFGYRRTPAGSIYNPETGEILDAAPEIEQDVTTAGEDIASFASQFSEGMGRSGTSALIGLSELAGADRSADYWRERERVMGEAYGGEGTGAGLAGRVSGRLTGELSQFMAPGRAVASAGGRLLSRADDLGPFARAVSRFANPSTRIGRVGREAVTGGPGQAAIAAAGPEESMLGLGAELTGSETLERAAQNPYLRAGAEVATDVATMGTLEGAGAFGRAVHRQLSPLENLDLSGIAREVRPDAPRAVADRRPMADPSSLREAERASTQLPSGQRSRMGRVGARTLDRELEEAAGTVERVRGVSEEAAPMGRGRRLEGEPERMPRDRMPTSREVADERARVLTEKPLPSAREAAERRARELLGESEAGAIRPGLASTVGGAGLGGAAGYAVGEEEGAVAGGLLGAGAGAAASRAGRRALTAGDDVALAADNPLIDASGEVDVRKVGSGDDLERQFRELEGGADEAATLEPGPMPTPEGEEGGLFAVATEKVSELGEGVRDFARKYFTVPGDMPDEVFQRKVRMDNRVQRELQEARLANRDLDRALRESGVGGGVDGLDEEGRRKLDDALKGELDLEALPEPVRPVVTKMRSHIDRLSRRMMDEGLVEGPLKAKVEKSLGTYAHRSYRAFDDPRWAEKVPQETRNKAKSWFREEIRARHPDLPESELEDRARATMNAYLYDKTDSPLQYAASGKTGSKDLSTMMRRKDVPEAVRELLGEYRDPRVNYVRSVAKMSRLMEADRFLNNVRESGMGRFLHKDPTGDHVARIAAEGSKVMEPLNGLYTTPEIKEAFEGTFRAAGQGDGFGDMLFRTYMRGLGAAKFSKTIGSLMTHVRNFVSNPMFLVANGNNPLSPAKWARAGKTAATNVGPAERVVQKLGGDTDEARDYFLRLQELGVVNQDARASELRDVVSDAMKRDDNLPLEFQRGRARKVATEATRTYQAEDDFWKINFFESEMDKLRRAMPDASEAELERRAAELTQNLMPNYSQVPEGVKLLRRSPVVGPFVSFWAESMRVTKNAVRQAAEELGSSNPAIRKIGARRAAGLLAAGTLIPAVTAASRYEHNIRAGEDRDIRRFLPPWSRNSNVVYLGSDEEGNQRYVDVSYTDPHSVMRKPVVALLNGESWEDKLYEAGREPLSTFLGEELVTQKVIDVARNRTRQGGEVYNPDAPAIQRAGEIGQHVGEIFEPGTITSARRIAKGVRGETSPWGKEYDPAVEAGAVATGVRLQTLDVPQALSFKVRDHRESVRNTQRILTSTASNRGEVGEEDLRKAYDRMEESRQRAWREAHRDAQAAVRLGVPERQVLRILGSSFSQRDARDIIRGIYRPYRPSDSFFESIVASVRSSDGLAEGAEMAERLRERRKIILQEARQRRPVMLEEDGSTAPLTGGGPQTQAEPTEGEIRELAEQLMGEPIPD